MGADQVFTYSIKTEADLKAFTDTKKVLEEQKKVYQELGQSTATLEKSLKQIDAALESQAAKSLKVAKGWNEAIEKVRSAGGNVDAMVAERNAVLKQGGLNAPGRLSEAYSAYKGAGGGLEGLKEAAGAFGKGPLIAAAVSVAAIERGTEALKEFAAEEEHIAKLDAAMAQRGLLSEENRKGFQELAASMEDLTAVGKGEWINVIQRLVQSGADAGQMNQAVEAVKNLAGILDGDLQSAAMHVGKALNGQFEAFGRLGIQFDEHMTQAQKLSRLWEELAARGGGQLEAQADTLTGSFKRLKNGMGDIMVSAGHLISEFVPVQAVMYGLGTSLSWVAEKFGGTIKQSDQLRNSNKLVVDSMAAADEAAKTYASNMDKTKESISGVTKALADYLTKLNEQSGNTKSELDAKFGRDTALIDKQVKEGKLTPQQAAIAKARPEDDKEKTKALIDQDTREKSAKKIDDTIASENQRVAQKQKEAAAAKAELEHRQQVAHERNQLDKRMAAEVSDAQVALDNDPNPNTSASERRLEKAKKEREEALKNYDAYYGGPGELAKAQVESKNRDKEAEEVGKLVEEENRGRIGQAQSLREAGESAKRVEEYQAQERRAKASVAVQEAGGGSGPVAGPSVSNEAFKKALPQSQASLKQLETHLEGGMEYWRAMAASMSRISNLNDKQKEYLRQILARLKDMEDKHDILEAQIRNAPSR